jgi:hypothetical protein
MVAAYMNRDATLFVAGAIDLILVAANQAKAYAQRKHRFKHAKTVAKITISSVDGAALSTAQTLAGVSLNVRSIHNAYLSVASGLIPIDIITRESQHERAKRLMDGYSTEELSSRNIYMYERPQLVQLGTSVMLWPWAASQVVHLDITQWMPDYVVSSMESDFFLEECHDWMLFQTIKQLNFFLKEDERVAISDAVMKQAWEAVLTWDVDYEGSPPILD